MVANFSGKVAVIQFIGIYRIGEPVRCHDTTKSAIGWLEKSVTISKFVHRVEVDSAVDGL